MEVSINHRNFVKLEKVLGDLKELPEYQKLKAPGFMDLNVDKLHEDKDDKSIWIALSLTTSNKVET